MPPAFLMIYSSKNMVFFFFFRMPWLSFASHLNPSPNFVFFTLFVPYLIKNPNKFLFIGESSGFDSH